MRQLKSKDEVINSPEMLVMDFQGFFTQRSQSRGRVIVEDQLIGVGAAVVPDGHGLAAPDQLRPALAEAPPPPDGQLGRRAARLSVPAFHRKDAEAVPDPQGAEMIWNLQRLGKGRERGWENGIIYREGAPQAGEVFCQGARRPETCHSRIRNHAQGYRPTRRSNTCCKAF